MIAVAGNGKCMVRKGLRASNLANYHTETMRVKALEKL